MVAALRRTRPLQLSIRTQMLVEKMNAFYLKNWDKEPVFDISQRVVARKERQWARKAAPHLTANLKQWKWAYTRTPFHKSADGQSPGDLLQSTPKRKWFWVEPPADFYKDENLPGCDRDYELAWDNFYKELQLAAHVEPEQVFTLLHDLHNEGWTVDASAYERADKYLMEARERRLLGIKPPITIREVPQRERWPGANPTWDEEWSPVLPRSHFSQANPHYHYKPVQEADWVHDPADWADGPLPLPQPTRWDNESEHGFQRRRRELELQRNARFEALNEQQNIQVHERWKRDKHSFPGDPDKVVWLEDDQNKKVLRHGVPLMQYSDPDYFIEKFYPRDDMAECLAFWKYTSDHIMLRHLVFYKTGKTLLEYSEPERFAILFALLDVKKLLLFESEIGKQLPHCWTDQDYIDAVGINEYKRFLRIEGRRIDEQRRSYLRLWSTEVAQEERLDQIVELTKLKHEDDQYKYGGIYGAAMKVRDRLERKKWAIREPSRQVQEHERLLAATQDERSQLLEEERERLNAEAEGAYGNEWLGMRNPSQHTRPTDRRTPNAEIGVDPQ
eukprot:TRINITY_DN60166_c0_g1_i1.p1 TRINITY_DN60166_c0_g1~~TRINITY_DN60166_c0_g1_i1.p1  ORF type:complete len:560 (+),score=194.07 TRINITY_DN60166_c0_g1_i1:194-1873(+)